MAPEVMTAYDILTGVELLASLRDESWNTYEPVCVMLCGSDDLESRIHVTPEEIAKIQAKGILYQKHTVNKETDMRQLLELGVDSILTDCPDLLDRIIKEKANPN